MRLGIDASNLREGGGVTHLIELLQHAEPHLGGFDEIVVWAGRAGLDALPRRPWITRSHQPALDRALPRRLAWQAMHLPRLARTVDLLFAPGGITSPFARPRVVMSRNMLPFEPAERRRYGLSGQLVRLELLARAQRHSFTSADGVIFLSTYAQRLICDALPRPPKQMAVIPHGVGERFRIAPRPARTFDAANPARVLYVSATDPYKHQCDLVDAIAQLRATLPVTLTLAGPGAAPYVGKLRAQISRLDPGGAYLSYLGKVAFDEVHRLYRDHDVFAFPSSCENMPNILVEAMSSGLPIACARRGPMPEMLGDCGVYFDPEDPRDIARALHGLLIDPGLRADLARRAHERARRYSWDHCARETFAFLESVARTARG